ncbi:hypothetical protein [Candidatus Leptofilum sp.]|uniref:hypothetical protein n=1 Tax=Candidatus Leptofilum sp. TaxID=3241576 RepID=UPI003B5B0BAD
MNHTNLLDLRPLSIGELFDRTFRLFRKHFFVFLGIAVITQLPTIMLQLLLVVFSGDLTNPEGFLLTEQPEQLLLPFFLFGIVIAIASLIFTQIGTAAITKAVSDSYLGRAVSFDGAFRRMGNSWLRLIAATLMGGLLLVLMFIPVGLIAIIPCLGILIAIPTFIVLGAVANIIFSLLPPVVVLENSGTIDSLKRAWELGRKRFWWVFGYLFLLGLLTGIIVSGPAALLGFLIPVIIGDINPITQAIIQQTVSLVLTAVFLPIRFTAITLMYFDLRIRYEGFDLMILASSDNETDSDLSNLTGKIGL